MKPRPRSQTREIALKHIKSLFAEAAQSPKYANRYVQLARKIAMKAQISMPREFKRRYCKHCYHYLTSKNSRIRTREKKLVIYCLDCKKFTRIPLR